MEAHHSYGMCLLMAYNALFSILHAVAFDLNMCGGCSVVLCNLQLYISTIYRYPSTFAFESIVLPCLCNCQSVPPNSPSCVHVYSCENHTMKNQQVKLETSQAWAIFLWLAQKFPHRWCQKLLAYPLNSSETLLLAKVVLRSEMHNLKGLETVNFNWHDCAHSGPVWIL